jgi:hypothetical protein
MNKNLLNRLKLIHYKMTDNNFNVDSDTCDKIMDYINDINAKLKYKNFNYNSKIINKVQYYRYNTFADYFASGKCGLENGTLIYEIKFNLINEEIIYYAKIDLEIECIISGHNGGVLETNIKKVIYYDTTYFPESLDDYNVINNEICKCLHNIITTCEESYIVNSEKIFNCY